MLENIKFTREKIRKLEIQGATSIAIAGLEAIKRDIKLNGERILESDEFLMEVKLLKHSRPNEPMLRNLIDIFLELKDRTSNPMKLLDYLISLARNSSTKIANYAKNVVRDGDIIYTHCHSSTVVKTLILAKKEGKNFVVYNTETRPKYQGRITARELAKEGIKVYHFVDFAISHFIKDVSLIFLGGDSIQFDGSFLNKVGSKVIAILANRYDIPLYPLVSILKVSKESFREGKRVVIEERDLREVWDVEDKNIIIKNYAFDLVDGKYVEGFITEKGFVSGSSVYEAFREYVQRIKKEALKL